MEAPEINELEANEEQLKKREKLDDDFEVGGVIVDELLPFSLQYYLGIEHDDDDVDEDDLDMEESDEEEDKKPKKKSKSKGKKDKSGDKTTE